MTDASGATRLRRRDSVLAAVGSLTIQGAALLTFAMLARSSSKPELGAYRQILVVQGICITLMSMGIPTAMLHRVGVSSNEDERTSAYAAALEWLIVGSLLCALVTGTLTFAAGKVLGNSYLATNAVLAGLAGGAMLHSLFIGPTLISLKRMRAYVLFAIASSGALLGVTWFWLRRDPTLHAALSAAAAVGAVAWLATGLILYGVAGRRTKTESSTLKRFFGYGGPVAASSALYGLAYQVDHIVALWFLAPGTYALYAAGAWQLPVGPLVQRAQADVLLPRLSAHHAAGRHSEFWRDWTTLVSAWTILGSALFWVVFPLAGDAVRFLLGADFAVSASVLQLYALILPLRMAAVTAPLRSAGITWLDVVASALFGVVSLTVGSLATPLLGLRGPAVGMIAGYVAWIAVNVFGTMKYLSASWRTILPLGAMVVSMLATGIVAGLSWAMVHALFAEPGLERAAAYVAMYGGAILLLMRSGIFSAQRLRLASSA